MTYRKVGPVLNLGLAGLCGWLLLGMAADLSNTLGQPPPPLPPIGPALAADGPGPGPKPWSEREPILARNLFEADVGEGADAGQAPPLPVEVPEEALPTDLPLGLLGTIASTDSRVGAAAFWVDPTRSRVVLTEGDRLPPWDAKVVEIARGRVLLSEDGELRELAMDEDSEHLPPKRRKRVRRGRRRRR